MALDVYLQSDANPPETTENLFLSFEDDGYFWFLHSFFEDISKQTGQVIDLCEDAFFDGENLELFNQMIERVRKETAQKTDLWSEFTGTIVHQDKDKEERVEKMFSTVHKKKLNSILEKLEKAVGEARQKNTGIFFCGD